MKASASNAGIAALVCTFALLLMTAQAGPLGQEDEEVENGLVAHPDSVGDMSGPWDAVTAEGLRKLLMQLDEERLNRATRSWPAGEPRGWGSVP